MLHIPIFINPDNEHCHRLQQAVDIINNIQNYYRCFITKADWLPSYSEDEMIPSEIDALVEENLDASKLPVVVVINAPLEDECFSFNYRGLHIISTAYWEAEYAPPPLRIYLVYIITEALLYIAIDLPGERIETWSHESPI